MMKSFFLQKKERNINCKRGTGKEVKLSNPRDNLKIPGICCQDIRGPKGHDQQGGRDTPSQT